MRVTNGREVMSGAAAAAAAIALLVAPATARATYECYKNAAGYQFPKGPVVIHYPETDSETRFSAAGGLHIDAPAETFYQNGTSLKGRITGDITKGGNIIRLTVTRGSKYPPLIVGGSIGPDGSPLGAFETGNLDSQLWDSPTVFACVPGAPVNDTFTPAPPDQKPVAAPPAKQTPKGLGSATVTTDTDIYDKPDGQGKKIGTLLTGEVHPLMEPCRDDWCRVGQIELGGFDGLPNGTAWVYAKGFLTFSN
jgi:hypothetical protein